MDGILKQLLQPDPQASIKQIVSNFRNKHHSVQLANTINNNVIHVLTQ
jgi:hypothetical protein